MLLMYMSAIFYTVDGFSPMIQNLFHVNPIFVYIKYFRVIVLEAQLPSLEVHVLAFGYALLAFGIGVLIYKKKNHKFLYYI